MNTSWTVVAGGSLWIIFHRGVYICKTGDLVSIHPINPTDLQVSKELFDKLTPSDIMLRFVIALQEKYEDACSTQVHAMSHFKFLANLIVRFKVDRDKLLLRKAILCCYMQEFDYTDRSEIPP